MVWCKINDTKVLVQLVWRVGEGGGREEQPPNSTALFKKGTQIFSGAVAESSGHQGKTQTSWGLQLLRKVLPDPGGGQCVQCLAMWLRITAISQVLFSENQI